MLDDFVLARAIHVLAVVHWMGGVAFVTLVVLPLAKLRAGKEGFALFELVERRFAGQVRVSIPAAGAAGFWMIYRADLWSRFADPHYWWMWAMVGLWAVFMFVVFIAEPLLGKRIEQFAHADPPAALGRLSRMHKVLLGAATFTIAGAVAGSHGFAF